MASRAFQVDEGSARAAARSLAGLGGTRALVVVLLAAGIFALDATTPPDFSVSLAYVPLVVSTLWIGAVWSPLALTTLFAALTCTVWWLTARAGPLDPSFNDVLILCVIVGSGLLCTWRRQADAKLHAVLRLQQQLTTLLQGIDLPIIVHDIGGRIRFWNRNAERTYGYREKEMLKQPVDRLFPAEEVERVREALRSVKTAQSRSIDTTRIARDGRRVDVEMTVFPLRGPGGERVGIATVDRDRTREVKMLLEMQEMALYDSLTSLPNRRCFYERLDVALGTAERNSWLVGLLFFDLDGFKEVNDSLGHGAGDRLLCVVSERLMNSVRRTDYVGRAARENPETTISRLGGDEFTVVLSRIRENNDAARTAKRMLDAISAPIDLEGHEVSVSSSVGIAIYPYDGQDPDTLIRNADTAMYHAKELGRGRCAYYSDQMNEQLKRRFEVAARLRRAVEQQRLEMHYQPIFQTGDGLPLGAELLMRWNDDDMGAISPAEFIPIAEETGLIDLIGDRALRTSCLWAASWARAGNRPLSVSVNVSTHQLRLETLTSAVKDALSVARLEPHLLNLEITESAVMEEGTAAVETINDLRALGVRVVLDDFGTGYSSLSRLRRLRLDGLKIDRSFVAEIGEDPAATELVAAILAMAKSLKMSVVAEGVETRKQLVFLRHHGCDAVQGFLLGHPIEGREFERIMSGIGELPRWPKGIMASELGLTRGALAVSKTEPSGSI